MEEDIGLLYSIYESFSRKMPKIYRKKRHRSPSAVNLVVILLLHLLWRSIRFNCNSHFDFVYHETDVKVCLIRIRTRISMLFSRDSIGTSRTSQHQHRVKRRFQPMDSIWTRNKCAMFWAAIHIEICSIIFSMSNRVFGYEETCIAYAHRSNVLIYLHRKTPFQIQNHRIYCYSCESLLSVYQSLRLSVSMLFHHLFKFVYAVMVSHMLFGCEYFLFCFIRQRFLVSKLTDTQWLLSIYEILKFT